MILLIGIDWSQDHHDVCIMNEAGAIIVRFEISHSPEGFAELEKNTSYYYRKTTLPIKKCIC